MSSVVRAGLLICTCLHLAGCSGSDVKLAPADGVVVFQGKPLPDATITFAPEKGPVAFAGTDKDGKFTLRTAGRVGVAIGVSRVTVIVLGAPDKSIDLRGMKPPKTPEEGQAYAKAIAQLQEKAAAAKSEATIPEKYGRLESSGLSYTVKADGNNHFKIELAAE